MLDPELDCNRLPIAMEGENFLLAREVCAQVNMDGIDMRINGDMFMSHLRLVVVGNALSVDLPLATIDNEAFVQPICGPNALKGENTPLDSNIRTRINWTIKFVNGGVGTFLPLFYAALRQMRSNTANQMNTTAVDFGLPTAFIDPNDPTRLFVSQ